MVLFVDIYRNLSDPTEFDLEEETGINIDELVEMFTGLSGDRRSAPKKELSGQRKKFRILVEALEVNRIIFALGRRYFGVKL